MLLLAMIFSFLHRMIISLLVIPIERYLGVGDAHIDLLQGFLFARFFALMGLPIARLVGFPRPNGGDCGRDRSLEPDERRQFRAAQTPRGHPLPGAVALSPQVLTAQSGLSD